MLFGSSRITLGILGRIFRLHVTRKDVWKTVELSNSRLAAWALGTLVQAYTLAWIGHFWLEKNRPATFKVRGLSARCSSSWTDIDPCLVSSVLSDGRLSNVLGSGYFETRAVNSHLRGNISRLVVCL